jgi:hypothetical protein
MIANLERIRALLRQLYPTEQAEQTYAEVAALVAAARPAPGYGSPYFSEHSVTLITYGDTLQKAREAPLETLHRFLNKRLKGIIDTVHILPFYPYSWDDGFSVLDYSAVDPKLGSWDDVAARDTRKGLARARSTISSWRLNSRISRSSSRSVLRPNHTHSITVERICIITNQIIGYDANWPTKVPIVPTKKYAVITTGRNNLGLRDVPGHKHLFRWRIKRGGEL